MAKQKNNKGKKIMRLIITFVITLCLFSSVHAEDIVVQSTVTEVMAYAKDSNYSVDECVIIVASQFSSVCPSNQRFVINHDTNIGRLMCSFALAALASNKEVKIGSDNDTCSPHQESPYVRFLSIIK